MTQAVRPDWAIFESSWQQICSQIQAKKIIDFRAILRRRINVKMLWILLRQLWKTFGQLF